MIGGWQHGESSNLADSNHRMTGPATPDFNRISWAAEDDNRWLWKWNVPITGKFRRSRAVLAMSNLIGGAAKLGTTRIDHRQLEDSEISNQVFWSLSWPF